MPLADVINDGGAFEAAAIQLSSRILHGITTEVVDLPSGGFVLEVWISETLLIQWLKYIIFASPPTEEVVSITIDYTACDESIQILA